MSRFHIDTAPDTCTWVLSMITQAKRMAVRQSLLDFYNCSVDFSSEKDRNQVFDVLKSYKAEGPLISKALDGDNGHLFILIGTDGGHWTLRSFSTGLVSLDITQISNNNMEVNMSNEAIEALAESLKDKVHCKSSRTLPSISRHGPFNPYLPFGDKRLVEFDIDRLIVEEDTEYQNVKILHSKSYGNMLVLNDDLNLAESDLAYTEAIMGQGTVDYKDKTVLILGGGDGGILHELLKQDPKQAVMVEIDRAVVNYAKKHLRGICGDSLDSLEGSNYEVVIGDCVKVMNEYIDKGFMFDYVINDLTAIPITTEPKGSMWDFMRHILDLSMKLLSPEGKYFTQGNSLNMDKALEMYEEQLKKLVCPVKFRKYPICVPSYMEMWVFYEIWKTTPS